MKQPKTTFIVQIVAEVRKRLSVQEAVSELPFDISVSCTSYCDGELSGLMQDKAATLFSPAYRAAVKGGRTEQDPSLGLFGGEKAVRSKLSEASKEDDLLKKTINRPNRSRKNYKRKQTMSRQS